MEFAHWLIFEFIKGLHTFVEVDTNSIYSIMGLDICLIQIVDYPTDTFLRLEENPELENQFGRFKNSREIDYGQGVEIEQGYYYEDLGYQRKGVKPGFGKRYSPDEFIFTKTELDELLSYIHEARLESFKADIADKFKEGITIVWMSY